MNISLKKIVVIIKKGLMKTNKKINNRGSLTIEAAIIIPFFFLAMLSVAALIQNIRAHSEIQSCITDAAMEEAIYSYAIEAMGESKNLEIGEKLPDLGSTLMTDTYAYYKVGKEFTLEKGQAVNVLSHDLQPTNYIFGSSDDEYINICLSYYTHPLFNIVGAKDSLMSNSVMAHKWTGYGASVSNEDDERIVYIAEHGTVYHLSTTCSHINPSIKAVDAKEIDNERNQGGGIFKPCEKCKPQKEGTLFITDYGEKYHSSLSCSGLKRNVRAVKLSEVSGMQCCKKCGK